MIKDQIVCNQCRRLNYTSTGSEELNTKVVQFVTTWQAQGSKRCHAIVSLGEAQKKLINYQVSFTVQKKEPTYGQITFIHGNLKRFDSLKKYVGEYGFVVPVKGTSDNKVLRGEKKLKYKGM